MRRKGLSTEKNADVDVYHPALLDDDHCIVKILNLQLVMKSAATSTTALFSVDVDQTVVVYPVDAVDVHFYSAYCTFKC